jgi:hypothetical protein
MTRKWYGFGAAIFLLWPGVHVLEARDQDIGRQRVAARTVRLTQGTGDTHLLATLAQQDDGGVSVTANSGELTIEKVVYADGRYRVDIGEGADRVTLIGEQAGLHVQRGRQSFALTADSDMATEGQRVREVLVLSRAVGHFRQIVAELDRADDVGPEALSLRLTGAVLAEVAGDVGAVRRLGKALTAGLTQRLRRARAGTQYPPTCWDVYVSSVNKAARELEACLGAFYVFNPIRQACSFVWTIQVEAAWFGLLKCAAVPLP